MAKRILLLVGGLAIAVAGVWFAWRPGSARSTTTVLPSDIAPAPTAAPAGAASAGAAPPVAATAPGGTIDSGAPSTGSATGRPPETSMGPELKPSWAASVIQHIGKEPAAVLQLVRRTRYEVYPGAFRGPAATLADDAGNDYDRAWLLHELLVAADFGSNVRYAFCTLSPQQAASAAGAARAAYVRPAIGAGAEAKASAASTAKFRDYFNRTAAFWKLATTQAREQTEQLSADFQRAGVQLTEPRVGDLTAIAADHAWVQVQSQGHWLDLDPLGPQAQPGSSLCTAATTNDSLPAGAFDTVTATLHLESRDGARQTDTVVASGTWRTADVAYAPLIFGFAESFGVLEPAPQTPGMLTFTPVLIAGSQTIAAPAIVVPAPADSGLQIPKNAMSKITDAFGDSPPAPSAEPSAPTPVALRLDVVVGAPHTAPTAVERPIFDRIPAAERAAGRAQTAGLADISILPFGTAWNIAVNLGTGVVGAGDRSPVDPASDEAPALANALGTMHRGYYLTRRAAFADVLGPQSPPVSTTRPGISFLGVAPQSAGTTDFALAMDRASEGATPDGGGANAGLAWGVASVYGERLAVGASTMMASTHPLDQLPFDDSIEMFYIARHSNIAPVLVRSGADVAQLQTSDDAKSRLSARLSGGVTAVVPATQIAYGGAMEHGWWLIAPDGTVTDEMKSGMHGAGAGGDLVGYAQRARAWIKENVEIKRRGFLIRCAGMATIGFLATGAGVGHGESTIEIAETAADMTNAIREANETAEMIEEAERCAGK